MYPFYHRPYCKGTLRKASFWVLPSNHHHFLTLSIHAERAYFHLNSGSIISVLFQIEAEKIAFEYTSHQVKIMILSKFLPVLGSFLDFGFRACIFLDPPFWP